MPYAGMIEIRGQPWDWEWRPAEEEVVVLRHGETEIRVPLFWNELHLDPTVFVEQVLRPALEGIFRK